MSGSASGEIIGSSPCLLAALEDVALFAPSTLSILITGENGTGKELVAHRIHAMSTRTGKLVIENCGAIPEALAESHFFGHAKGAFTGAVTASVGQFKIADKGTIFLDEVGELSLDMQVKLLRVLESSEFHAVGSNHTERVDIRIVSATNRDLRLMVEQGEFREDLYWRLHGYEIELPALRERGEDIITLCEYYLARFNKGGAILSQDAHSALLAHPWPGNVRELRSEMHAASILMREGTVLELQHLPMTRQTTKTTKTKKGLTNVIVTPPTEATTPIAISTPLEAPTHEAVNEPALALRDNELEGPTAAPEGLEVREEHVEANAVLSCETSIDCETTVNYLNGPILIAAQDGGPAFLAYRGMTLHNTKTGLDGILIGCESENENFLQVALLSAGGSADDLWDRGDVRAETGYARAHIVETPVTGQGTFETLETQTPVLLKLSILEKRVADLVMHQGKTQAEAASELKMSRPGIQHVLRRVKAKTDTTTSNVNSAPL